MLGSMNKSVTVGSTGSQYLPEGETQKVHGS